MQSAPLATLEQVENFEFRIDLGKPGWPPMSGDLLPPTGKGAGPNPEQFLAVSLGQCLSSTLLFTLQKARVPVAKMTTRVRLTVGKNEKGRARVRSVDVEIDTRPVDPKDQEKFDQSVAIFADYCTVSGAVREGIPTTVKVSGAKARP